MKNLSLGKKLIIYYIFGALFCMLLLSLLIYTVIIPETYKQEQYTKLGVFENTVASIDKDIREKAQANEDFKNRIIGKKDEEIKALVDEKIKNTKNKEEFFVFSENKIYFGNVNKSDADINYIKTLIAQNKYGVSIFDNSIYILASGKTNKENIYIVNKLKGEYYYDLLKTGLVLKDKSGSILNVGNNKFTSEQIFNLTLKHHAFDSSIIEYNGNISLLRSLPTLGVDIISIANSKDFYVLSNKYLTRIALVIGITLIIMSILYAMFCYAIIKNSNKLKGWIHAIQKNELDFKINISSSNIFSEIAVGFKEMAERLRDDHQELEKQTEMLYERNWQVEEANKELEDSYLKLQDTINQLNEAEEKYYSLVKNLPEIVCVIDLDGVIGFINDVSKEILGYTKEELIGQNIDFLVEPRSGQKLLGIVNKRLRRTNKIIIEIPLNRKDGTKITTEVKVTHHYSKGVADGIQAIIRDITKNKKLQNEIIHKNEELLTIYNISKSLSSTIELDNVFSVIVNEVCKILNADMCLLRTLDFTGKNLIMRAYSGNYFNDITELDLKEFNVVSVSKVPEAVFKKEMAEVDDFDANWSIVSLNKKKPEKERIKQVIFMPICAKEKILGLIMVGSKTKINEKRLSILTSISNNAAVALENATLYENSKKYFIKTIDALIAAVEAKDKYTEGHSRRVSKYVEIIGRVIGLSKEKVEDLKIAGILHDVGKIGISDNILLKPGRLTEEEYEEIKQHPIISNRILYSVGLSETTMKAIACHHERYDGEGYPFGLKQEELSIECQIIAVADALDAMTSNRSYRGALTFDDAIKEIIRNKGGQFGPEVVDVVISIYENEKEKLLSVPKDMELIG